MQVIKLLISGKVQGVGYRRWFEKLAIALKLNGYVKNLPTGEVEAVVVGNETVISRLITHCYTGSTCAHVAQIDVTQIEQKNLEQISDYTDFKILR